jgi:ABC-type cobalamin transport system ATPase subunit
VLTGQELYSYFRSKSFQRYLRTLGVQEYRHFAGLSPDYTPPFRMPLWHYTKAEEKHIAKNWG